MCLNLKSVNIRFFLVLLAFLFLIFSNKIAFSQDNVPDFPYDPEVKGSQTKVCAKVCAKVRVTVCVKVPARNKSVREVNFCTNYCTNVCTTFCTNASAQSFCEHVHKHLLDTRFSQY